MNTLDIWVEYGFSDVSVEPKAHDFLLQKDSTWGRYKRVLLHMEREGEL